MRVLLSGYVSQWLAFNALIDDVESKTLNKSRAKGNPSEIGVIRIVGSCNVDQQFHDFPGQSLVVMSSPLSWTECIFFSVILFPNLFLELPLQEFLILCFLAIPFRKFPEPLESQLM